MFNVRRASVLALVGSVVAATLLGYRATASAGAQVPDLIDFLTLHKRPVAGEIFRGLAIVNRSPDRFSSVRCDGEIAGKRLPALKLSYPGSNVGARQVVLCGWRIPLGAGGEELRLWDYGGGKYEHRAVVQYGDTTEGTPGFAWGVKKR